MTAEPGKLVGGKYRLEKPLAKGGMGSVWLARHTELDAPAAVKFMAPELVGTPAAELRFKREARAAAQLRSPHVVHIHDYGVEDGAPFMVMELLEGHDLANELAHAGKLPVARVAAIVAQVAKALTLAHAAGIVHRDLKPSNLFVSRAGEDEIVKVLDFGVAKETMSTLVVDRTTSGVLVGSPQYMSPEQARGEQIDARSDLWSLGVVAFEALTGRPPFESTHLGALLAKIGEANPPAPTSLAPELPAAIDDFVRRALARRPEDRFPSAKAMADALSAIAAAPDDIGAKATATVTIVPAKTVAPRDVDTLPAGTAEPGPLSTTMLAGTAEPDPVSRTMPEQPIPKGERARGQRGTLAGGAALVAIVGIAAAIWLGMRGDDPAGSAGTSEVAPQTSSAFAEPPPGAPAPPSVEPAGTASAPATTIAASPSAPASVPSAASPSAPTSVPSTAASARSTGAPARTATTSSAKPAATSTAKATTAPTTTPATTSAPPAQPAYDPVFGLPATKP
jgi:eukaryotic-like serine/threonine-protein kinase